MVREVKKSVGRPRATDRKDVVSLLVSSFHNGLTVREACWQSGISHEAYYGRLRIDEQFADTMAKAQSTILVTAKKLIVKEIREGNVAAAKWWLERKARDEFGHGSSDVNKSEVTNNQFATLSDDDMRLLGIEISKLVHYDNQSLHSRA